MAIKQKISYTCTNCTYQSIKWLGCCPECKEWDSFCQTVTSKNASYAPTIPDHTPLSPMTSLDALPQVSHIRMLSGIAEWDRVMGGGIIQGSLLVLTGDPGIGKSTLLLQVCNQLAQQFRVFYFSTEESLQQVKMRAERLSCTTDKLLFSDAADLQTIIATTMDQRPNIIVIDSIQNSFSSTLQGVPGSIAYLRDSAFQLMRLAKENSITIIITGHITKEGTIAGPKTLEHMVDAVFYLQGEDRWQMRILHAVKNRFGTINELGFFQMEATGLQQVANINQQLINEVSHSPGSVLVSVIEGSRPLLIELQALTIESKLAMPQRIISGIDHKQVVLIAAILQKYLHIQLNMHDIFFKVSGGFKIKSSGTDLGIALALLSSYFQQPVPEKSLALGEISLTGQIKPINQINQFIHEATAFGIERILVAKNQTLSSKNCTIIRFQHVYELLSLFNT